MMKLFSIVGARPQFIKVAALHRAIIKKNFLQHFILHTGQHYDDNLSEIFFTELNIPKPAFSLNIPENSESSGNEMQKKIEKIFIKENPDLIIVYGDTKSTLAGALAAKNSNIKLAHIEAGLRSYNSLMPEEFNRIETDKISDLLFCPTKNSVQNLIKEKYDTAEKKIIFSGDVMLDNYNFFSQKIKSDLKSNLSKPFTLCTLHRQSLMQSPEKLSEVIKALNKINKHISVILPAHPRLKQVIKDLDLHIDFTITEPVGYLRMIKLLQQCELVITDSGGLQKEAFFSKKICITLRDETEWIELAEASVNFIAGDSSCKKIITAFQNARTLKGDFSKSFYGDGNAAEIIVNNIANYLSENAARAAL